MSERKYWIADAEGAKALVVGAEARDFWTTQGWHESAEPDGQEFVWLQHNAHEGRAKFNAECVPLHASRGWFPSDPPPPVNLAVAHREAIEPLVAAPQSTVPASKPAANATSGDKKE